MQTEQIKKLIESQLTNAKAIVSSPDNVHFNAIVICDLFAGKSKLQQQQMVNHILQHLIRSGEIHSLSLKTYTCEAWENRPNI